ncbi:bifunctional riboflavin kinase/FAD synthetase [Corynebacterium choanae]|uniref:Riboflavin biosynthesis protein n=1 Tax=Corynebacterium choanae TaxID=1862358 RepID=A0A3G6J7L5_9CORY|nr:bifunctional riboflavin kinase/FAD synthetase [Corynebacterium choanae]AZA13812.1 Riboflavin biosynthesis protein RibF [Corynebacterium choanae]
MFTGVDAYPSTIGPCVVTIGMFDGVHRGHQSLIDRAAVRARQLGLPLVLVTFDPHPLKVVAPQAMPALLGTVVSRCARAEEHGVDYVLAIEFDAELAAMSPAEFFSLVIVDCLQAQAVFVGENFTFGHKASGNTATLQDLGRGYNVEIHIAPLLIDDDGATTVSSSAIRQALAAGDVAHAGAMLGRPYSVSSVVCRGAGRGGRELGYPTANLYFDDSVALPADGVYCGWFVINDDDPVDGDMQPHRRYPAAISVGNNPTFGDARRSVEAFVLDQDAHLYDRQVSVSFVDRIRGMEKFTSVDELLAAMARDVAATKQRLDIY